MKVSIFLEIPTGNPLVIHINNLGKLKVQNIWMSLEKLK